MHWSQNCTFQNLIWAAHSGFTKAMLLGQVYKNLPLVVFIICSPQRAHSFPLSSFHLWHVPLSPNWLQWPRDLEVYTISRQRRGDEGTDPAEIPPGAQALPDVVDQSEAVGPATRVPLARGLATRHQRHVEEQEAGHEQEAHHTGVSDEGESKGSCCYLTCKRIYMLVCMTTQ